MPFYRSSPSKQTLTDDEQLSLPLAIQDAPREVRDHGLQEIHSFPWCPAARVALSPVSPHAWPGGATRKSSSARPTVSPS